MYIFFDLDDTLLTKSKEVTPYTKKILEKCRSEGHKLIINTARGYPATKPVIELINPDYIVVNAGALILDKDLNIIHSDVIKNDILFNLIEDIHDKCEAVLSQTKEILYSNNMLEENEINKVIDYKNDDIRDILKDGVYKVVTKNIDYETALKVKEKYDLDYCIYFSGRWSRFCMKNATKAQAVKKIIEYENASMEDTIAFGDDVGDLDMLLCCKVGVAMKNSVGILLEKVQNVTLSCEEDGVARFLENYFEL